MDVVPELLKNSDNIFYHLTARSPEDIKGFEAFTGDSQAIKLAVPLEAEKNQYGIRVVLQSAIKVIY
ncbi:MAG: hypothetical protein WCS27_11100 [Victivallaceae bacterium]